MLKKILKSLSLVLIVLSLLETGSVQAGLVYSDSFDNDTLATNSGIGGGATNNSIQNHNWGDNGNLSFLTSGTQFERRALVFSTNSFQSSGGFELTVEYTTAGINRVAGNRFSFGLVRDDTDLSQGTYNGFNPFQAETSLFSLGVNVQLHDPSGTTRGLWFTDGTSATLLDQSGTNQEFVTGSSTPVVIRITPDGLGGADWSYSINGIQEAASNLASFDFSQGFHFVAYGQDDQTARSIQSVSLAAVPEPSSLVMLGLATCLAGLGIRRRHRSMTSTDSQ